MPLLLQTIQFIGLCSISFIWCCMQFQVAHNSCSTQAKVVIDFFCILLCFYYVCHKSEKLPDCKLLFLGSCNSEELHMTSNGAIDNQIHSNCGLFLPTENQWAFSKFNHKIHLTSHSTNIMLFAQASLVRCSSSNNFHHDASWMAWHSRRTIEVA